MRIVGSEAVSKESILCQEEDKISTAGFSLEGGKSLSAEALAQAGEWVITKKSKFYFLTNIGQPLLRQPRYPTDKLILDIDLLLR